MELERTEEMPNTSPLCINKPKELPKRSKAPKEVCTGVNMIFLPFTAYRTGTR
jgi:hypothetical protein